MPGRIMQGRTRQRLVVLVLSALLALTMMPVLPGTAQKAHAGAGSSFYEYTVDVGAGTYRVSLT
ncbi:MAG: hypothetical protein ACOX41_03590 [Anaerovoracaceae bacterium]|jgi:hypothetical protein